MAKIAIIGSGISGLGAAYILNRAHDITVYEKSQRIGGHTRTLSVDYDGTKVDVDTGFIVFNQKNYPELTAMFRHLNVPLQKSDKVTGAHHVADFQALPKLHVHDTPPLHRRRLIGCTDPSLAVGPASG